MKFVYMDSYKHFVVKMTVVYELELMGHDVDVEVDIPGRGKADIIDNTTLIQYEIDGHHNKLYRTKKARKYLRPGLRDVVVIPINKLSTDINRIRSFVMDYIVPE